MANAFFTGKREQFFRPLTHADRECCAAVLRSLYDRVQGPNADYSEALTRELLIGVVFQALADPPLRAVGFEPGRSVSAEEERAYAGDLLRKLKEHGWIEDYKDPIDLKPTLKMTRAGKEVSEVLSSLDNSRARTRQRNMRSAKKALAARPRTAKSSSGAASSSGKATSPSTGRNRRRGPQRPRRASRRRGRSAVRVVDSSVWIDFFDAADHPAVDLLQGLLGRGEVRIVVPGLVLFEVLRGFRLGNDLRQARRLFASLSIEATGGAELALAAVEHYRSLRAQGFTLRSAIDVLVATFCIENDCALLHRDPDLQAFEALRGLRGWSH